VLVRFYISLLMVLISSCSGIAPVWPLRSAARG